MAQGATCDANPCQLKQKLVRTQRLCGHKINPKGRAVHPFEFNHLPCASVPSVTGCIHAEVAESYVSKNATRIVKQWAAQRGKHYGDMREAVKQTCELFDVEHALELVDAAEASRSAVVSGAPGSRGMCGFVQRAFVGMLTFCDSGVRTLLRHLL